MEIPWLHPLFVTKKNNFNNDTPQKLQDQYTYQKVIQGSPSCVHKLNGKKTRLLGNDTVLRPLFHLFLEMPLGNVDITTITATHVNHIVIAIVHLTEYKFV